MGVKLLSLVMLMFIKGAFAQNYTNYRSVALPGCEDRCGSLVVPYPFGIRPNCSASGAMEIHCNTTFNPPKAFSSMLFSYDISNTTKDLEVLNISLEAGPFTSTIQYPLIVRKQHLISQTLRIDSLPWAATILPYFSGCSEGPSCWINCAKRLLGSRHNSFLIHICSMAGVEGKSQGYFCYVITGRHIVPQTAVIAETGERVNADQVQLNTINPGDVIPIDGVVVQGNCDVNICLILFFRSYYSYSSLLSNHSLSTPVAAFCALSNAAKSGLLVKGAEHLETLAKVKIMAFDKTGTITTRDFLVADFKPLLQDDHITLHKLLYWVASIESKSSHPMAEALVEYAKSYSVEPKPDDIEDFQVKEFVERLMGKTYMLGTKELLFEQDVQNVRKLHCDNGTDSGMATLCCTPRA